MIVVAPLEDVRSYWEEARLTMAALPDPEGTLAADFGQPWSLWRGGRQPALYLVDPRDRVAASHHGAHPGDRLPVSELLPLIEAEAQPSQRGSSKRCTSSR